MNKTREYEILRNNINHQQKSEKMLNSINNFKIQNVQSFFFSSIKLAKRLRSLKITNMLARMCGNRHSRLLLKGV